jgi:hypothetical protein
MPRPVRIVLVSVLLTALAVLINASIPRPALADHGGGTTMSAETH